MSSLEPTQCLIIEMCQLLISSKFELLEGWSEFNHIRTATRCYNCFTGKSCWSWSAWMSILTQWCESGC
jgi:hypothetical protein